MLSRYVNNENKGNNSHNAIKYDVKNCEKWI